MLIIKKHRDNIRSVLAYSNATPIRGYWGEGYVCAFCPQQFPEASALQTHTRSHGNISKLYKVHHVRNHVVRLDVTGLKRKKTTHERLKHSLQTKSIKCGYCKMRFQSINQKNNHELRAHMKQQTAYSCNSCEKSYARQRSLRDHINKDHLLQRPYKCPQKLCKKAFYLKKTLQAHILTHGDAKPFPCAECSKEYRSEKALKEHMYTHNDRKEFKCNKCSKSYIHRPSLPAPKVRRHSGRNISRAVAD
ncbi:Gonadotropin inducible transcription factor, partial [Operophtera brumata]